MHYRPSYGLNLRRLGTQIEYFLIGLSESMSPVFSRPFLAYVVSKIPNHCIGRRYATLGKLIDVDKVLLFLLREQ